MNQPFENEDLHDDALLTEMLQEAGDVYDAPRKEHLRHLHSAVSLRLTALRRPLPIRFEWSGVVAATSIAATLILGLILWTSSPSEAFADVVKSVQAETWIHGIAKRNGAPMEFWLAPSRQVSAVHDDTTVVFDDHRVGIRHQYEETANKLVRLPHNDRLAFQSAAVLFQAILHGDKVRHDELTEFEILGQTRRETLERSRTWIEHEFTIRGRLSNEHLPKIEARISFLVAPRSNLPLYATVEPLGSDGTQVEFAFDYPKTGPGDIFAMGVPRTAELIDHVPTDDLQPYLAGIEASRQRFDDYQALVHEGNLYRITRKGNKWKREWGQKKPEADLTDLPPRYSNAWFQEYAKRVTFIPIEVCDGTTVYRARLSHQESNGQQVLVGWEVKGASGSNGIDAAQMIGWSGTVMPEFHTYPLFPLNTAPLKVGMNEPGGPADSVLLYTGNNRYWCNPTRSYAVAKYTTTIAGDPRVGTLGLTRTTRLEDLSRSPGGIWYAQTVLTTTSGFKDIGFEENTGEPFTKTRTQRFNLDFDTELPDSIFEPKGHIFQTGENR